MVQETGDHSRISSTKYICLLPQYVRPYVRTCTYRPERLGRQGEFAAKYRPRKYDDAQAPDTVAAPGKLPKVFMEGMRPTP
jgi:hypothetical protein